MAKRYRQSSVPRNKRVFNESDNTIIDTGIPDLNGVKAYTQPVHNAKDKTSVCKYCAKNIVRGYICYDCRELEAPVKRKTIEERLAIEEGLAILQQIRIQEALIKQEDRENSISYSKAEAIVENYCKTCGMHIPIENNLQCDYCN